MWPFNLLNDMFRWIRATNQAVASLHSYMIQEVTANREAQVQSIERQTRILYELDRLRRKLPPPRPPLVLLEFVSERTEDMQKIRFNAILPPLDPKADVVERELTVTELYDDRPNVDHKFTAAKGDAKVEGISLDQGASVMVSLVDIDDGGNRSEASVAGPLEILNTFPPAMPGMVALEFVGEETVEETNEPAPEPTDPPV
jgi:hypothetical protein